MFKNTVRATMLAFAFAPASAALCSETEAVVLTDSAMDNITAGSSLAWGEASATADSTHAMVITETHTSASPNAASSTAFGSAAAPSGPADATADAYTDVSGNSVTHSMSIDISVPGVDIAFASSITVALP